jgi:hypothetical protein
VKISKQNQWITVILAGVAVFCVIWGTILFTWYVGNCIDLFKN